MAVDKSQSHRAGVFKQTNKEHKHGKHRSKGALDDAAKVRRQKGDLTRDQRRNQSAQIRQKKREEILAKKRALGGYEASPFLIAVLPLNREFDPTTAITILCQCDEGAIIRKTSTGVTHICLPRFKKRFSFVVPANDNELDVIDTLKVADQVLFLLSAINGTEFIEQIVDQWGKKILKSGLAQGLPTPIVALADLDSVAPKKRADFKLGVQKMVTSWLPKEKLMVLDRNCDGINILRRLGDQKRKTILYRDHRPYVLGEELEYIQDDQGSMGTLKVTGYLKGATLSVNQLVHIPGLGDFQLAQVDAVTDPNNLEKHKCRDANGAEIIKVHVLEVCDPTKQESLDLYMSDAMDVDNDMLPSELHVDTADQNAKAETSKPKPEGWSDYQAAWIPDDDTEFQQDGISESDTESEGEMMDARSEDRSSCADEDSDGDSPTGSEIDVNDDKYDNGMDLNMEQQDLEKLKAAKADLIFPDEIDTPHGVLARDRFRKYRALESFRYGAMVDVETNLSSPWDPLENLPNDYSRICQFKNFAHAKKSVFKEDEKKPGAMPGLYLTVHVKNVSQLMWSAFEKTRSPVILSGLFPHEHKMSICNVVLRRTPNYGGAIKSKDRLIFQCGFRRFMVNPIFSQHTNGTKHKFERYFQIDETTVATFYAPVQFPPAPVLCYKEVLGTLVLVATGSLLSCDSTRLIIKRTVLSGHPFKIFKKSAIIRFMFFDRQDIMHFKPCRLVTKMGRRGHIMEPLGTHGHMKCIFDGQLKSQDTVLLNLYKRVFPKWTYEDLIVTCENQPMNMETS
ncbi:hypothetical protein D910_09156 [Dendroctonus ponderosae]|uniref:Pre-rRNA-processing protein TSR1 homolog n=1 Tax=Dendroctonus ponderosae TaxID=77166 RepID=U4UNY1_DENPD|nr:hypothetical protein D910_09156 [Dendroctonus ponderosae]